MLSSFWPAATVGDTDAARIVLRTLDSLAKLCGFELLARMTVPTPISNVDFANEAARLIESIASMGGTDDLLRSLPVGARGAASHRRSDGMVLAADDHEPWSNIGD